MGTSIFTWDRKKVRRYTKANKRFMESRWNLHQSERRMEIPLQSGWSDGYTIDFMLSAKRDRKAAKRFFKKALGSKHNQMPRVITVDRNPAYPSPYMNWKMIEYYLKT